MHGGSTPVNPKLGLSYAAQRGRSRASERILDRQRNLQEHLSILTAPLDTVACLSGVLVGRKEGRPQGVCVVGSPRKGRSHLRSFCRMQRLRRLYR